MATTWDHDLAVDNDAVTRAERWVSRTRTELDTSWWRRRVVKRIITD
jgi:hypothetical protein